MEVRKAALLVEMELTRTEVEVEEVEVEVGRVEMVEAAVETKAPLTAERREKAAPGR